MTPYFLDSKTECHMAEVQIVRPEAIAYDEALRASGVAHDEALQAALDTADAEQELRDAAHAGTEALKQITSSHDEALQEATVGYLEALRSAAPVPPPALPADDLDPATLDEQLDAEPEGAAPKLIVIDDLSE